MKTCPTCGATCFDDMEVCYGCLHRFGEADPAQPAVPPAVNLGNERVEKPKPLTGPTRKSETKRVLEVPAISVVPGVEQATLAPSADVLMVQIQVPRSARSLTVGYGMKA